MNTINRPVLFLVLVLSVLFGVTPALTKYSTEFVFALFAFAVVEAANSSVFTQSRELRTCAVFSILYAGMLFVYKIVGISSCEWYWLASYLCWLMIAFSSFSVLKQLNRKTLRLILFIISTVTIINEMIIVVRAFSFANTNAGVEAAGTQFGTMLVFYASLAFVWILKERKLLVTLVNGIGIILAIYINVSILQRATNLLLLVLLSLLLFVFRLTSRKKNSGLVIFVVLIAFFVLLWLSGLLEKILSFTADNISSSRIADRLRQIVAFLRTGDISETNGFSGRYDLMIVSLKTWVSSPTSLFFGVGDHRSSYLIIGNHSDIIDSLARYGLIGFLLLICVLFCHFRLIKKELRKCSDKALFAQIVSIYFAFILRNIVGNSLITYVAIPTYLFSMCLVYSFQERRLS